MEVLYILLVYHAILNTFYHRRKIGEVDER